MRIRQLNHVALRVSDVDRSVAFYRDVLRLPVLDRPAFDFPGAWLGFGEDQELHLIGDPDQESQPGTRRGGHFALVVDALDEWEHHLDQSVVSRMPRKERPDGAQQTFLQDPDGHWIELCVLPD